MILETPLTEKLPVACTKLLSLIFSTGWCKSTQGTNFDIFVRIIIQSVTSVTYVPLGHSILKVGNYVIVLRFPII